MEKKAWTWVVFWGFSLVFFVMTLVVIRWTIDFVNWSTLDSGWAQATGSVGAIVAAIFIFKRQSADIAAEASKDRMLVITERNRAVFEKRAAAHAIASGVLRLIQEMLISYGVNGPDDIPHAGQVAAYFDERYSKQQLSRMQNVLDAIPLHDLNSFQFAEGVIALSHAVDEAISLDRFANTESIEGDLFQATYVQILKIQQLAFDGFDRIEQGMHLARMQREINLT